MNLRKRVSKNVYDLESVRMVPHPALEIASAAEAKHYAATYALFRVCIIIEETAVPVQMYACYCC